MRCWDHLLALKILKIFETHKQSKICIHCLLLIKLFCWSVLSKYQKWFLWLEDMFSELIFFWNQRRAKAEIPELFLHCSDWTQLCGNLDTMNQLQWFRGKFSGTEVTVDATAVKHVFMLDIVIGKFLKAGPDQKWVCYK